MDTDKLKKLREIQYKIAACCGTCVHAKLQADGWGTCTLYSYQHQKHTDDIRELSITQYGHCVSHATKLTAELTVFNHALEEK